MRHNKLAGTRFLLGSRKHKPSTFTSSGDTANCNSNVSSNNNMLHSKSTYFYRWFRESLDLVVSGLSTKKTSYLVPAVCGAALLGTLGFIVNPVVGKAEVVYAAEEEKCKTTSDENGYCAMELAIFMNGTDGAYNELPATELSADNVVHRDYNFSVRAVDTKDGYNLYAGVVNTGSFGNNLVNADYPTEEHMIKALSGTDVAYSSISNNEWGYALTSTNQNAEELNYNSLPVATITTEGDKTTLTNGKLLVHGEDTGYDPSQPVGQDKHTDQDYKLYFAAKAGHDSPAGHYRTQVMLSLVASPRVLATTMQYFTADKCSAVPVLLKDIRDGTKYWVSKLKDGKCWMTQNLDLKLTQGMILESEYTDSTTDYTVSDLSGYADPGLYAYNASMANTSLPTQQCGVNPADDGCKEFFSKDEQSINSHYLIGDLYNYITATLGTQKNNSGSICPKNWRLPTSSEYSTLINGLTQNTIRQEPYYFVPGGFNYGKADYFQLATRGNYWTSTPNTDNGLYAYSMYFNSSEIKVLKENSYNSNNRGYGNSVRCIFSGA